MAVLNANAVTSWNQNKYAKVVSALLFTKSVAMGLANTELRANMPDGTVITRPTTSFLGIQQYTANNEATYSDLSLGNETLTINDTPMVAFTLDQIDDDNAGWNISMNTMENVARLLREYVDGKFFAQVLNFTNSNGSTVALTSANAYATMSSAIAGLINAGIDDTKIRLVVDAFGIDKIGQNAVSSVFSLADKTYTSGYTNREVAGGQLVRSENLTMVGSFSLAGATPTDGDTVKINGYTFTFKTALGATPGQVLIGASGTTATTNLVAAINGTTPGTSHVALLAADRNKFMRGLSATANTTTTTFTSTRGYRGAGAFSKTMTNASNKFGQFVIYYAAMEEGAINMVMRDSVKSVSGRLPKSLVTEFLTWSRFGLKVFADGAERGIIIPIEARAAE